MAPPFVFEDSLGVLGEGQEALGLFRFELPASFCKLCSLLRPPHPHPGPQDLWVAPAPLAWWPSGLLHLLGG